MKCMVVICPQDVILLCEKEVKKVLNVTNIRGNKRKKVFKGAMERNPGVEEKEKKARCL